MANYYISQSSGNNANDGSEATPFKTFKALTSLNFLASGDNVNLLRNDEWIGSDMAAAINSSGDDTGYITFQDYGTGSKPLLTGSPLYTAGYTLSSGTIYYSNSSYASEVKVVGIGSADVLCRSTTRAAMDSGTFFYESSSDLVFVWLLDSSDPNSSSTYIGVDNIFRVKASGSGNYIKYKNIKQQYNNGTAFRITGNNGWLENCDAVGCGTEGFHFSRNGITSPGAQYTYALRCVATLCNAGGTGYGQAFTTEAADTVWESCLAKDCFMAGFDFLDFNSDTDVSRSQALWCEASNCGQWINSSSIGDPQFYIDGANNTLIYGCIAHGGGTGRNAGAGLFLDGIQIGNEHPVTKTVTGNKIINCQSYNNTGYAFRLGVTGGGDTIDDTQVINCTFNIGPSPAFTVMTFANLGGSGLFFRNNIVRTGNNTPIRFISTTDSALFDSDNNNFFRTTGTDIIEVNSVSYDLSEWQTLGSEDASSVFANPNLISVVASTFDSHLGVASGAIDIADATAWTGSPPVRGISVNSGGYESPPDNAGYYYNSEGPFQLGYSSMNFVRNSKLTIAKDSKLSIGIY